MKEWLKLFKTDPLKALSHAPLSIWLVATAIGGVILCLNLEATGAEASSVSDESSSPSSLDTYIPRGFVLIPLEIENYDSLDSILGSYGVVDLYLSSEALRKKAKPIARKIKILRAPKNPSQFAVLVPEFQATRFFHAGGSFFAAVQNPAETGTDFEIGDPTPTKPARSSRAVLVFGPEDP